MYDWLINAPLSRLFLIIAIGYLVGEIKFPGGFRLGVAGVLFVGLAGGALSPMMELPPEIQSLGLALFVYCIGLQAGPGFFKSFKREGLRLNLAVLVALAVSFLSCYLLIRLAGRSAPLMAGLFTGALTNTPALGAVTEALSQHGGKITGADLAVVGYGIAYPVAVIFVLLLVQGLASRPQPAAVTAPEATESLPLPTTIAVTLTQADGTPWTAAQIMDQTGVVLTRFRKANGKAGLITGATSLPAGTLVLAVGSEEHVRAAATLLGSRSGVNLQDELRGFEDGRYFVSNAAMVERPLRELALDKMGAIVSRLRRGDVDIPVTPETTLRFGDRVRVISYRDKEPEVRKLFGDSITVLTETGYFSFAVGIVLGLILGQVPIPIPGLAEPVKLGIAGGPLLVALALGAAGRTGPFIWSIPNEANLTLRHLGILFFLAAVGVKAGRGLLPVLQSGGLGLILLGIGLLVVAHGTFLATLYFLRQRDLPTVLGALAGFQTQPAVLTFAAAKVPVGPLNVAYATVYPLAVILKIILAQLLVFHYSN